jgi:chromosome partitioning protein
MKIAVVNLKGGSGKTLSSFFLATTFSARGRTLLVDCDLQGSALSWARSAEEEEAVLPFGVMGLPVKDVHRRIRSFTSDFDAIARSALMASDLALVVVPPTPIDLDRVLPTLELVADVEDMTGLTFHVLLTRVRRIAREGRDTREAMAQMGLPVLQTEIPFLSFYQESFGRGIVDAREYEQVVSELLGESRKEQAAS